MKKLVLGLIPTWQLSCGHTIVSPIMSTGTSRIINIPKSMPCPKCEEEEEHAIA